MQVGEQVFDLLIAHDPAKAFHLAAAVLDDLAYPVVVRRQPAQRQVLLFEDALQWRALLAAGGIRLVATVTIVVVESAALGLLRVEAELLS